MRILRSLSELSEISGPLFLAIGVFDGVHLGHRAVIERVLADAKSGSGTAVVLTFDPHPLRVLRPNQSPRLLTSTQHKLRLIEELGVKFLLIVPFDAGFAETPPEEFIGMLHDACKPLREICVGHQWSFGRNRAGNLEMLGRLGSQLEFEEVGVPAVEVEGNVVSSTLIRAAVQEGRLDAARKLLGRDYTIFGTVVEGDHLGRKLGFPTANISAHNEQFPPDGVYAVQARLGGSMRKGVANIGIRPTISEEGGERLLEVHLFDFDGDIYGEDVEVSFKAYLREEMKFPGLEALKAQIARDAVVARSL